MIEILYLRPLEGQFNVRAIEEYLEAMPFTFRDPKKPQGPYFVCGDQAGVNYFRHAYLTDPDGDYPYTCLAIVEPQEIAVRQICGDEELAQARQFVEWVTKNYKCKITDDYGNDWTEECKISLDILYSADED